MQSVICARKIGHLSNVCLTNSNSTNYLPTHSESDEPDNAVISLELALSYADVSTNEICSGIGKKSVTFGVDTDAAVTLMLK